MSKPKPKLKSKANPAPSKPAARASGKSIVESAQHIWLAGLGAFAKAQDEGTRLFEALVRDAFGQRRKTLRNAVQQICSGDDILAAGLRPEARAEDASKGYVTETGR